MVLSRNVAGKPGNKGYTKSSKKIKEDAYKLQEQYEVAYSEWKKWIELMEKDRPT